MMADVERARDSNSRFDDVKQLLQLSENERVKLMDQVEQLQEDNLTWRPIQKTLEQRVEALLHAVGEQIAELGRLREVENDLRAEKDKVSAANIQVASWQDIAADLQAKCERWELVTESAALQHRQAKAELTRVTLERQQAEAKVEKYSELLEQHSIPMPEDDEVDALVSDEEEDDELAAPLTTLRTTNLLRGKLTADTVPTADDIESGLGDDARVEEPAFGTFEKQA